MLYKNKGELKIFPTYLIFSLTILQLDRFFQGILLCPMMYMLNPSVNDS